MGAARIVVGRFDEPGRVLLWDLDGTIVDTSRDLAAAINGMLREYGWPPLPVPVVVGHIGKGAQNLVARCLEEYGHRLVGDVPAPPADAGATRDSADLPGVTRAASVEPSGGRAPLLLSTVTTALAVFEKHYAAHLMDETEVYPGVAALLARLAGEGRPMAVVTNKPEGFSREILRRLGLDGFFRAVVGGETLPTRKPAPEPLWYAARLATGGVSAVGVAGEAGVVAAPAAGAAGVAAPPLGGESGVVATPSAGDGSSRAVMIGDTWIDAEAARAAGLPVILVGWGLGDRRRAEEAAPDAWAETAEDLGALLGAPPR